MVLLRICGGSFCLPSSFNQNLFLDTWNLFCSHLHADAVQFIKVAKWRRVLGNEPVKFLIVFVPLNGVESISIPIQFIWTLEGCIFPSQLEGRDDDVWEGQSSANWKGKKVGSQFIDTGKSKPVNLLLTSVETNATFPRFSLYLLSPPLSLLKHLSWLDVSGFSSM